MAGSEQPKAIARPEAKAKPLIVKSKPGIKPDLGSQRGDSGKATSPVIPQELREVAHEAIKRDPPGPPSSRQQEGDIQMIPQTTLARVITPGPARSEGSAQVQRSTESATVIKGWGGGRSHETSTHPCKIAGKKMTLCPTRRES